MDDQERALLDRTFEHLLTTTPAADLPGAVLDSGWSELVADDGRAAMASLFTVQGRTGAASAALDLVVIAALGRTVTADVAVVYPRPSAALAPGATGRTGAGSTIDGLALAGSTRASTFVTAVATAGGPAVVTVDADTLTATPVGGFDPSLGLMRVTGTVGFADAPLGPGAHLDSWSGAIAAARHALAYELVGATEAIFDVTVDHVQNRVQFGKAIGSRQSVKHRIADIVVALDGTRSVLEAFDEAPTPLMAAAAKALAGRAALLACNHGQQLCGAIGFTVEHPMPGLVARAQMLDTFLGSAALLAGTLGDAVLAGHLERPYPIRPQEEAF